MYLPFEFISTISLVLIAAAITVFTFAVTLLGKAIQFAKIDESKAENEQTQSFQERISDLQNRFDEAKKKGNSKDLEKELDSLKKERLLYEKKISSIKNKYSYLNFREAVAFPILFFISSLLLSQIGNNLQLTKILETYIPYFFIIASVSLLIGSYRFRKTLLLIQEVSSKANKDTGLEVEKLPQIIEEVFIKHEEELKNKNAEKLSLKFTTTEPFECKTLDEFELKFRVALSQGKTIKNVNVWFFLPDDITLIRPSESVSWRQEEDYGSPNKKTVKVLIGDVNIGPYIPGILKIKAPNAPGTYPIYYRLYGEGYQQEERQTIQIIVNN